MDQPVLSLLQVSPSRHFKDFLSNNTQHVQLKLLFVLQMNVFFFLVTVWKLAQKFTSLNPDLDKLQKIK